MRAPIAVLVIALAGLSGLGARQTSPSLPQQPPTFRSEIRLADVDVSVTDNRGQFVSDLLQSDFEILEDDAPQAIVKVTTVNLPIGRNGRLDDAASTLGTPATAQATDLDDAGRVYILILDSGNPEKVRTIARLFVERYFGPADLMAVMHVGAPALTLGLTNDRNRIVAAIDRYGGLGSGGLPSFRALKDAAVNLNAVTGRRKAILFVGLGTNLWSQPEKAETLRQLWREYDDAARTAARNNVRIYPVDPTGLPSAVDGIDITSETVPTRFSPIGFLGPEGDKQSSLRLMAEDTGGIAIVNTNNFGGNFQRVVRDNSAYYVLRYSSTAPRDGRFHRLTVRVKNRPDLRIRARAGYVATTPDVKGRGVSMPKGLSSTARNALRSDTPEASIPVDIFTAVFQADQFDGSVLIGSHIDGSHLKLDGKEQLELSYVAIDNWGVVRAAQRRAFTIALGAQTRARVQSAGLRLFGRLQLPRGRYQIRVAASQPGGVVGSAVTQIEVPDFTDQSLVVSDVVVASSNGPELTTLEEDPILRRALPAQPTASRRFHRNDTLTAFVEIYDAHRILSRQIGVTATLIADGRVLLRQEQVLESGNRDRYYFTGRVPLNSLTPGQYALSIEANTRSGIPASASRELRFTVAE